MSLVIAVTNHESQGKLNADFNLRLQHRGTDFIVPANTGYQDNDQDSVLLRLILKMLLTDDSGVTSVRVTPFRIEVNYSHAVSGVEDIQPRIVAGAMRTGKPVTVKEHSPI